MLKHWIFGYNIALRAYVLGDSLSTSCDFRPFTFSKTTQFTICLVFNLPYKFWLTFIAYRPYSIGYKPIISRLPLRSCPDHRGPPDCIYHLDPDGRTVHFHQVGHVTFHAVHFQIHPQSLLGSGTTEWEA